MACTIGLRCDATGLKPSELGHAAEPCCSPTATALPPTCGSTASHTKWKIVNWRSMTAADLHLTHVLPLALNDGLIVIFVCRPSELLLLALSPGMVRLALTAQQQLCQTGLLCLMALLQNSMIPVKRMTVT